MSLKSRGRCQVRSVPVCGIMRTPQRGVDTTPVICRTSRVCCFLVGINSHDSITKPPVPEQVCPGFIVAVYRYWLNLCSATDTSCVSVFGFYPGSREGRKGVPLQVNERIRVSRLDVILSHNLVTEEN